MKLNDKQIKEIEKIFSIKYEGLSRIDGSPLFNAKKDKMDKINEFFKIEILPILEDNIQGYMGIPMIHNLPAGQKDCFILKFYEIKKNYIQHIRKEKLKKLKL
jgi:hypothetical protein